MGKGVRGACYEYEKGSPGTSFLTSGSFQEPFIGANDRPSEIQRRRRNFRATVPTSEAGQSEPAGQTTNKQ
jgi:hypothetical protein